MEPIKLNVNGVALIFTDDAVSYAGHKLHYNQSGADYPQFSACSL